MDLNELTIGNLKELNKILNYQKEFVEVEMGINIVILDRGWVLVGELSKKGSVYHLKKGSVVRVWGTSKGIGEIAENGPTSHTILDSIPETIFSESSYIMFVKCEDSAWKK